MTEKEQRAKFQSGRPIYSDEQKMIAGMNGLPDSSSAVFLKQAKLQDNDNSYEVFGENMKKIDPSASVFFGKGARL